MAFKKQRTYRAPSADKLRERGSRTSNRYDSIFIAGVTTFKPTAGTNQIRLVKDPDADYHGEPIWVHAYVGIKNSTYLCPKMMGKAKYCPICEMADEAARAGDKDERYQLEAKERVIAYILDRNDSKNGLKVWDMSWTMDRDLADACIMKKTGQAMDITHPDTGYDVFFQRQGTTKNNTKYHGLQVDRESTPLHESQRQADAFIDEVQEKPLLSLLKYRDEEYLADILSGKVEEKDEDEADTRERPERGRRGVEDSGDPTDEYVDELEGRGRTSRGREREDPDDQDDRAAPTARRGSRDAGDRQETREVRGSRGRPDPDERSDDAEESRDRRAPARETRDTDRARAPERVSRRSEYDDRDPPRETSRRGRSEEDDYAREREQESEAEGREAERYASARRETRGRAPVEPEEEAPPPRERLSRSNGEDRGRSGRADRGREERGRDNDDGGERVRRDRR